MSSLLDKVILFTVGVVAAAACGVAVAFLGLYNPVFKQAFTSYAGMLGISTFASWMQGQASDSLSTIVSTNPRMLALAWLAPPFVIALIGQVIRMGSWMFYVPGMAIAYMMAPAAYIVTPAGSLPSLFQNSTVYLIFPGLLVMGAAAGLVYWGIAGWQARTE